MPCVHLYGASNLWLSRGAALAALRCRFEGPLEVGLACGPGRSYGVPAGNLLVRYLPLRLVRFPHSPQLAILSDAGNDIAYGQRPELPFRWMTEMAERLEREGAQVVLTGTPLENLQSMPEWLFLAARSLLYPGSRMSRDSVLQALEELRGSLQALARQRGYLYLSPDPSWYGLDRIHLNFSCHDSCWERWLGAVVPGSAPPGRRPGPLRLLRLRPAHCWVLGREWRGPGEYTGLLPATRVTVL